MSTVRMPAWAHRLLALCVTHRWEPADEHWHGPGRIQCARCKLIIKTEDRI